MRHPSAPQNCPPEEAVKRFYSDNWLGHRIAWGITSSPHYHMGYHADRIRTARQAGDALSRLVAQTAGIDRDSIVLDSGCGLGGTSIIAAKDFGSLVLGVCNDERMIRNCRRRAGNLGVRSRATFLVGDMCNEPQNRVFDAIISIESASHIVERQILLRHWANLLNSKGTIVIADYFLGTVMADSGTNSWISDWLLFGFCTVDDYARDASSVGLKLDLVLDITKCVEPSVRRISAGAAHLYWPVVILRKMGLISETQFRSNRGAIEMGRAFDDGIATYKIIRFIK